MYKLFSVVVVVLFHHHLFRLSVGADHVDAWLQGLQASSHLRAVDAVDGCAALGCSFGAADAVLLRVVVLHDGAHVDVASCQWSHLCEVVLVDCKLPHHGVRRLRIQVVLVYADLCFDGGVVFACISVRPSVVAVMPNTAAISEVFFINVVLNVYLFSLLFPCCVEDTGFIV